MHKIEIDYENYPPPVRRASLGHLLIDDGTCLCLNVFLFFGSYQLGYFYYQLYQLGMHWRAYI